MTVVDEQERSQPLRGATGDGAAWLLFDDVDDVVPSAGYSFGEFAGKA